jgi:filamentous hemagglutinin
VLAVFGARWLGTDVAPAGDVVPAESVASPPATLPSAAPATELVMRDVTVRDSDGRVAWRGDVDLAPVLERIAAGERDPHRNDGGIFGNREGLLPARARGYYREYVVRTPGITHVGPQRVVLGRDGEVFYTADHYESFQRVR